MFTETLFCPECRTETEYTIVNRNAIGTLKGEEVSFVEQVPICSSCKSELFVSEIEELNRESLCAAYREKNEIISMEEILSIVEKYNIGKQPLSELLGWGAQTFSRYCDGMIPTKQYSDVLKRMLIPKEFLSVLEEKQSCITLAAYKKAKTAAKKLIADSAVPNSKLEKVVCYLLTYCDNTQLTVQKALYYAQGFYKAFFGQFLFEEQPQAWVYGPVYPSVYANREKYHADFPFVEIEDEWLTESEKEMLDAISKHVCCYSGVALMQFTHKEMPWLTTRGGLSDNERSNAVISKDLIGDYFSSIKEKHNMLAPTDISDYMRRMFDSL